MAININDQFNVNAGKAVDSKYGKTVAGKTVPYASTAEANAAINSAYRYEGLTVAIDTGSGPVEYWYTTPLADINLVTKAVAPTLDSYPSQNGTDAVQSSGIYAFVTTSIANAAGRVFNAVPSGGWQIGDIWLVVDGDNNLLEIRKITSNVYGWLAYNPGFQLDGTFSVFSPEYNVLTPNNANGNDGEFTFMAAIPVSNGAQYGPKPTNIWAEYFQKQSGAWVSFQQLIFTVDPYSNGHTNPTDGEIETNSGNRMAFVQDTNTGSVDIYQYYPLQYERLAVPGVARPVTSEPTGGWSFGDLWFYIDSTSGNLSEIRSVTAPPATEGDDPTYNVIAEVSTGASSGGGGGTTALNVTLDTGTVEITGADSGSNPVAEIIIDTTATSTQDAYSFGDLSINYSKQVSGTAQINFNIFPVIKTKAGDPNIYDIPAGLYSIYKNTSTGTLKLFANDGGVLKSVTLS